MDLTGTDELLGLLEGRYTFERGDRAFTLDVRLPDDAGSADQEGRFRFTRTVRAEDGSKVSETLSGPCWIEEDLLVMDCHCLESTSWDAQGEILGGSLDRTYDEGPILAEIRWEPEIVLALSLWEDVGLMLAEMAQPDETPAA